MLSVVSVVNFFIDPGAVYFKKLSKFPVLDLYVQTLLSSPYGMKQEGWKERDVKLALAKRTTDSKCIVLGSSHVMSVSGLLEGNVKQSCASLMNLGVSRASIEDLAIFSEVIIQSSGDVKNKKIMIGLDPWMLNFNRSSSYLPYAGLYHDFLRRVDMTHVTSQHNEVSLYRAKLLENIISADYFQEVKALIKRDGFEKVFGQLISDYKHYENRGEYIASQVMPQFDFPKGAPVAVTLPDGGHVYSSRYINEAIEGKHGLDAKGYQLIRDKWYEKDAVKLFAAIVSLLQQHGYTVVIMLTPYHQHVWNLPSGIITREAMAVTSGIVRKLAKEMHVVVMGSYDPRVIGCTQMEFYDFMHARPSCLDKMFGMKDSYSEG